MLTLALILIGTIGIIYVTTFHTVYKKDQAILAGFTENYERTGILSPGGTDAVKENLPEKSAEPESGGNIPDASILYAVAWDKSGTVLDVMNDVKPFMTDAQLVQLAGRIRTEQKTEGIFEDYIFRRSETADAGCVVLMSNKSISSGISDLMFNTIVFGLCALVILFVLSIYLADRILHPLEESYQKQKQFISDAGHELKTPISTINANSEMLQREIGENQWLKNICYENNRMSELVKQLLDLARTENAAPVMEEVDLSRLVMGGTLPLETVAFERGYEIESEIEDNVRLKGDPKQLGQLVSTLLDNAISYAEGEGRIHVKLYTEHGNAVLRIGNPGREIPETERERIFERFYRSDSARPVSGHYGLGLAIAKAITIAHHGRISADSQDGETSFTAVLPLRNGK